MPDALSVSVKERSHGYQLRVVQEVLLALLAREASHGYELRARLQLALGPLAEVLNAGHVYVTLNRLEKAGLVTSEQVGQPDRPNRKMYELTAAGRARVMEWLEDTSWPKPAPAEFHLKLVAAAAAGLGDPVGSWTCSGTLCWRSWQPRSAPRSASRMVRSRGCSWRASC